MAVEVKTILALLAFFLFRKAIVKARCRRLERLRMLVMSRQRRLRSFLASLVNNAAATNALDSTTYALVNWNPHPPTPGAGRGINAAIPVI